MTDHKRTHTTPPTTAPHAAPVPVGDVVPGDPPVPITVWHVPAATTGETMSNALGVRLVANFTHPTDLIIDLTDGPQLARGIIAAGRRRHPPQPGNLSSGKEPAALVVTGWPLADTTATEFFATARIRLRPGGCVAVVLRHAHPSVYAALITDAHTAGLTYLQHIVAATGLIRRRTTLLADGTHLRVHTDILVLARRYDREQDPR